MAGLIGGGQSQPAAPVQMSVPKKVAPTGPQLSPEQIAGTVPRPGETDEQRRARLARATLILGGDYEPLGGGGYYDSSGEAGGVGDAGSSGGSTGDGDAY